MRHLLDYRSRSVDLATLSHSHGVPPGGSGTKGDALRIATLIISLVLMLVLAVQSLAVAAGGSLSSSLSTTQADQKAADDLAAGGAVGLLAALLWLIAAALVLSKPKASIWLFGAAAVMCLLGASSGFSDLYIWAGISAALAALSWRGLLEKRKTDAREHRTRAADMIVAARG